ncbi:hypothetical protein [Nocardioides sp. YIM 152315]|uniref:hypothetical protein n=1 Tax=Nocardioides sp. YIM 152315 TaxID=3031760 RepID=UPI0023DC931A|nr:hypothetical protein [Nocardioides sp. YIM 152315]MDF1604639.1 hypothetical protein [Nocardioides sp. YIM 152315]
MTVTTTGLSAALQSLGRVLDARRRPGVSTGQWRWRVRQEMAAVRDALVAETGSGADGWTAAREGSVLRERNSLLARIGTLGSQVLEHPDPGVVHVELQRLLVDVGHHAQRLSDLAYDEVELELGGSE